MAEYTTELRTVLEEMLGYDEHKGQMSIDDIIAKTRTKLFDFEYPIFDLSYRVPLETKIMRHFYMREIGAETVGLFKHYLTMTMNEQMPYFNQLYKSTLLEFNPLYDVDIYRKHEGKDNNEFSRGSVADSHSNTAGNTNSTGNRTDNGSHSKSGNTSSHSSAGVNSSENGTTDSENRYSDTPQGTLNNIDNNTYLTNATLTDGRTTSTGSSTSTDDSTGNTSESGSTRNETLETNASSHTENTDTTNNLNENTESKTVTEYLEHVAGKQGSGTYSHMLTEYRATFLNIDTMVIHELEKCFMSLW
ncbi:MAG: hypothetical protein NC311_10745 [Muribaculaceae bacterium]|nr:hypothetical protein [Muribaculaceae bacterium]